MSSYPFTSSLPYLILYLLIIFYFTLFLFLLTLSIFLLFHSFPFYQSSCTPFLGQMWNDKTWL